MKTLRRSHHVPRAGDIFYFQILPERYHWGRVVSTSASVGGFNDCVLIYIFDVATRESELNSTPNTTNLLVSPIATNRRPWTMGYFVHKENREIRASEVLPVHCFYDGFTESHFDEKGNNLPSKHEPCSVYGLGSFQTIDEDISEALGIASASAD